MKTTNKKGEAEAIRYMRIVVAHKKYQQQCGKKIGFSTFVQLRPKTVKLQKFISRN
jgi:hypothetical protein